MAMPGKSKPRLHLPNDRYPNWRQDKSGIWLPRGADWSARGAKQHASGDLGDGSKGDIAPQESSNRLLPGLAAIRRVQRERGRDRIIATRQLVGLALLLILVAAFIFLNYNKIAYRPPHLRTNGNSAAYRVQVPAKIEDLSFVIGMDHTEVTIRVSAWEGKELAIMSQMGSQVPLLNVNAQLVNGEEIRSDGWTKSPISDEGNEGRVALVLRGATPPSKISFTLDNEAPPDSGQYRFVRTGRIEVQGGGDSTKSAEGVVEVQTDTYTVDRFESEGISRPGESEGSKTRFSVTSAEIFGASSGRLPIPAVSIDLLNVEKERARDPELLVLGAALGMAGALVIEFMLTGTHLTRSRVADNEDAR
ncbi:hypothetical protein ACQP2C_02910 [Micromonospora zamorensis]|uniref:hypothetical protein n=1 Tax=Micromonospora zamorensis TaxID=709883 RepID=UPI003D961ED5